MKITENLDGTRTLVFGDSSRTYELRDNVGTNPNLHCFEFIPEGGTFKDALLSFADDSHGTDAPEAVMAECMAMAKQHLDRILGSRQWQDRTEQESLEHLKTCIKTELNRIYGSESVAI